MNAQPHTGHQIKEFCPAVYVHARIVGNTRKSCNKTTQTATPSELVGTVAVHGLFRRFDQFHRLSNVANLAEFTAVIL